MLSAHETDGCYAYVGTAPAAAAAPTDSVITTMLELLCSALSYTDTSFCHDSLRQTDDVLISSHVGSRAISCSSCLVPLRSACITSTDAGASPLLPQGLPLPLRLIIKTASVSTLPHLLRSIHIVCLPLLHHLCWFALICTCLIFICGRMGGRWRVISMERFDLQDRYHGLMELLCSTVAADFSASRIDCVISFLPTKVSSVLRTRRSRCNRVGLVAFVSCTVWCCCNVRIIPSFLEHIPSPPSIPCCAR